MAPASLAALKAALCLGAVVLALTRSSRGRAARVRAAALGLLALLAAGTYYDFGRLHSVYRAYPRFDARAYLHLWDLYHYYLGAKYFPELGYRDLYRTTLLADEEGARRLAAVSQVRDMDSYRLVPRADALAAARTVRERFRPEHWRQFVADVDFFTEALPPETLAPLLTDHGYNPSPTWTATARLLTTFVPARSLLSIALLDELLVGALFLTAGWAFGLEAALFGAVLFFANSFSSFSWVGGSFLRYDWLFCSVLGLALLRRGRHLPAGVLFGYAAAVRIFPALFLLGPLLSGAYDLARRRKLPRAAATLGGSFLCAVALFAGWGALGAGASAWSGFADKIAMHNAHLGGNAVGYRMVFLYEESWSDQYEFTARHGRPGETAETSFHEAHQRELRRRAVPFLLSGLLALLAAAWAARRSGALDAVPIGFVAVFMFLALSQYYYLFLVLGALLWAREGAPPGAPWYLSLLFLLQVAGHFAGRFYDFSLQEFSFVSWATFAVLASWIVGETIRPLLPQRSGA